VGAQLVGQAFIFATRVPLTPNEFRLLLWMSHRALDSDKPPRYFAARESSALALGRIVPDQPDPFGPAAGAINREREAAFQRVKIATQGLVKARAIRSIRRGREGSRAEYAIAFDGMLAITPGTPDVPLEGTSDVPLSGSSNVHSPVRQTYPQGTTEEYKEPATGKRVDPALTHLQSVEKSVAFK
jgi:hypothetical protein